MSVDAIFGTWNDPPTHGVRDELSSLWHKLADQGAHGSPEYRANNGMTQRRSEIIMLWELYQRAKPNVVVEIGTAQGGTFAGWCVLGQPDATIISIDRDCNDCRPRYGEPVHPDIATGEGGAKALGRHNQKIIPITGWSHDPNTFSQLMDALDGKMIDWMFHDASHKMEMTVNDFKIYWPLIADGGVMAFHDIMPSTHIDVTKSIEWERIKREEEYSACYEFRGSRHDDSMGIGVIIR